MKTMHILSLAVLVLALALAPGFVQADLVLEFDDPDTSGIDFQVKDGGPDDNAKDIVGLIEYTIDSDGLSVGASAVTSISDRTRPDLLLNIVALSYTGGSLNIRVTDTDFGVSVPTPAAASVLALTFEGGEGSTISFDFYGDTENGEFVKGFNILSVGPEPSPSSDFNLLEAPGSAEPVGSLTMSASVVGVTEINTAFTLKLKVNAPVPVECPPNIIGRTVDRVDSVSDGCVIDDAIIENGDVNVNGVDNFRIFSSTVKDGDIDIKNVTTSVEINGNAVNNGKIRVIQSSGVEVNKNIVNGQIVLQNNTGVRANRNITSSDIEAENNKGKTIVNRNIVTGTGSIKVDDNEIARVIKNKVAHNIECEDNVKLISRENEAGQNDECPKPDRGLFD